MRFHHTSYSYINMESDVKRMDYPRIPDNMSNTKQPQPTQDENPGYTQEELAELIFDPTYFVF